MSMDLKSMLELMTHKRASDLFLTTGVPPTIKVNGRLVPVTQNALSGTEVHEVIHGMMSDAQRQEFTVHNECNFAISAPGIGRFRVSAFIQRNNPGAVLRRIESRIPTVEGLRLPRILNDLAMTRRGMVLMVGATGTGKSTSLAAMIGYRNRNSSGHIICIEDPIEYIHEHAGCIVTQREVGIDTDSYEMALKNTLRQAPDVILIGEIRTRETMENAIAFAETGHLCLATLHANNANQALDRIIHFFPEDRRSQLFMDLSLNLKAVVAQQLIRKPDGTSRVPVIEVMLNTPLVADLVRKGDVHKIKDVMKRSRELGMQTFDQALYDLHRAGEISYEDAISYADSQNEVRLMIKLGEEGAGADAAATGRMSLVEDDKGGVHLR